VVPATLFESLAGTRELRRIEKVSESLSQPPLPLLAKEGSSENRGCLFNFHLNPSILLITVIEDLNPDQ
jgi:hypothetical protein